MGAVRRPDLKNKDKDSLSHAKNLLIAVFCAIVSIQGSRAFFSSQNRQELSFYTKAKDYGAYEEATGNEASEFLTADSIDSSSGEDIDRSKPELQDPETGTAAVPILNDTETGTAAVPILSDTENESAENASSRLININSASSELLQELKGIGPSKAGAIIEYREAYGGFAAKEELMEVKGIGPATYEKIKDYITLE